MRLAKQALRRILENTWRRRCGHERCGVGFDSRGWDL
jgi:hypothetical protein